MKVHIMDYIKTIRHYVGHQKIILVSSGAFVFNKSNEVLLQRRADNNCWCVPGGFVELNESVKDAAKREVKEETGIVINIEAMQLLSIYSGPQRDVILENKDEISNIQMVFVCDDFCGELVQKGDETADARFFSINELPNNMHFNQLEMIGDLKRYILDKECIPFVK